MNRTQKMPTQVREPRQPEAQFVDVRLRNELRADVANGC